MKITAIIVLLFAVQLAYSEANHLTSAAMHDLNAKQNHDLYTRSNSGGWWTGFIFGPILFFCSFVCIWYNEKRAAIDSRRLSLGR